MALADLQRALARAFVDGSARALLRTDPAAFGRANGLDHADLAALTAIPSERIEAFAASLERKARHDVGR